MLQRRYTPPTCTLEILAEDSPLSRWSAQPVLNQLRFELSFDDPRQPEDHQVKVWGDRAKLEALHEAVRNYVQDFLKRTPEYFPIGQAIPAKLDERNGSTDASASNIYSSSTTLEADFANARNSKLSLKPSKSALEDEFRQRQDINKDTQLSKVVTLKPYLQPKGLLAHDLFLGPLATENSGSVVTLSATQLFDLATALDEYAADVMLLPTPKRASGVQALPPWSRAAALVVVTVGVAFAAVKGLEQQNQLATTASKAAQDSENMAAAPQEVAPQPPGQVAVMNPTAPTPPAIAQVSPLPMPNANTTVLAPTAPNKLLPPPPPAGALQRPPMMGQMGQMGQPLPSANSIPNSAAPIFTTRLPTPSANRPNLSASKEPNFQVRQANLPPTLSLPPLNSSRAPASATAKNPFRIVELPSTPTPPRSDNSVLARLPQPAAPRRVQATPQPQAAPPQQTAALPKLSASPIEPDELAQNSDSVPTETVTNLPPTIDLPAARSDVFKESTTPSVEQERTLIVPTKPVESAKRQSVAANEALQTARRSAADEGNRETAFDTIPQVAQARNYLQKRWKAPESLAQSLEYYLFVNPNGSIERILPLGQAAATLIDRTNIPLPGEQFVSPIEGGRTAKLRAVFNKDGKVQTFLEETN